MWVMFGVQITETWVNPHWLGGTGGVLEEEVCHG